MTNLECKSLQGSLRMNEMELFQEAIQGRKRKREEEGCLKKKESRVEEKKGVEERWVMVFDEEEDEEPKDTTSDKDDEAVEGEESERVEGEQSVLGVVTEWKNGMDEKQRQQEKRRLQKGRKREKHEEEKKKLKEEKLKMREKQREEKEKKRVMVENKTHREEKKKMKAKRRKEEEKQRQGEEQREQKRQHDKEKQRSQKQKEEKERVNEEKEKKRRKHEEEEKRKEEERTVEAEQREEEERERRRERQEEEEQELEQEMQQEDKRRSHQEEEEESPEEEEVGSDEDAAGSSSEEDASPSDDNGSDTSSDPPMPVRRGKRFQTQPPESDADPDKFDITSQIPHNPDRHGWTRDQTKLKTKTFKGPRPSGPTFPRPNEDNPLDYFLSFFPLILFQRIARYTNQSINPKFRSKTTLEEIKAWFGIRVMQGVHTNTNAEDDWSVHPGLRNNLVSSTMTRGRFYLLSEVLACTNPAKGPKKIRDKKDRYMWMKCHPLYPLQVIWDSVSDNCLRNYNPQRELSLDEAMIKYKGTKANIKRVFMPLKPTKMGFKIYAVCEARSGYLLHMKIHSKEGIKMKDLSLQMMEPFFGWYHQLHCDKLYTSVALAKDLLSEKTYLCGAVKRSSRGLPDDFSVNPLINPTKHRQISLMHKCPRGTLYSRQQGQLTMVLWRDTKVVSLLSTCHPGYRNRAKDHLTRNIKERGERTSSKKQVPAPPHAIDYTQFMGGVDRADQLRSDQSCSRQSMKWWRKVLYFLVDVARVNAWLCYKHNTEADLGVTPMSHRQFTVEIATRLIAGFAEGTPAHQAHTLLPVPKVNGPNHVLIRMPSKNPKMCIQCRTDGRRTRLGHPVVTRTGCTSCNIHLCKDVCFLKFHSA